MEGAAETGGGPVSSRWNPTKEQISILENLYKQGVRTPSAEQIQQITSLLKGYGHIEGKNVFYWFQNHKARQRQKQKQDTNSATLAYFNHLLHFNKASPLPHFPSPNVVCSPYYVHQNDVGFYPQYHNNSKMLQSSGIMRRRPKSERRSCNNNGGVEYETCENEASAIINLNVQYTETLPLFPTHPTGDLQVGPPPQTPPQATASASASASASSGNSADDSSRGCRPYFEFFL